MTLQKIEKNIQELNGRLENARSKYHAMVIRNCITTMEMKRKEVKRELRAKEKTNE